MVFILPGLSPVYSEQVTRITASILFIIGPLTLVVGVLPVFRTADHAVEQIAQLEAALDRAESAAVAKDQGTGIAPDAFGTIALENVRFSYKDCDGHALFTTGPIDLTIAREETLLIVGGNGSGKSTLLKLIAGLYYPDEGVITVDDRLVQTIVRELSRAVFCGLFRLPPF